MKTILGVFVTLHPYKMSYIMNIKTSTLVSFGLDLKMDGLSYVIIYRSRSEFWSNGFRSGRLLCHL